MGDTDDDTTPSGTTVVEEAPPAPLDEAFAAFLESRGMTIEEFKASQATLGLLDTMDPEAGGDDSAYEAFEMPIMVIEGVDTGDGRYIDPGVLTWRDLPQPVMGILKTTYGHQEAELVGRLDSIERIDISKEINPKTGAAYGDGVSALKAAGVFAKRPQSDEISDLVRNQFIRGVSVDMGDVESVLEFVDPDGNVVEDDPFLDFFFWSADGEQLAKKDDAEEEDEPKLTLRERMTAARVMGVTICPFPAFEGAYIRLSDGTESTRDSEPALVASAREMGVSAIRIMDEPWERDCEPCKNGTLTASSEPAPMYPPAAWFAMPEPDELTPVTITDDGRIFGHIAGWQTCHTGQQGTCVLAPRSATDYTNFHVGALKTAEGDVISVGRITLGTGHADLKLNAHQALEHYDNTGTASASIVAKNGKHGVWFSGALEPDMDELKIRKLRGSALSGDWRPHGRGLELIAVLAVNTPGFLVPRARVASGRPMALVAAGVVQGEVAEPTPERNERLESFMAYVLEKDAAELRATVKRRHDEAQARELARNEAAAAALRARVHGASV